MNPSAEISLTCWYKMMMDNSSTPWFSELVMEDLFLSDQCDFMDFLDEELSAALGEDFLQSSLSPNVNSSSNLIPTSTLCPSMDSPPVVAVERPAKQLKLDISNLSTIHNMPNFNQPVSTPFILTFGNPNSPEINIQQQVNIGTLNPGEDDVLNSHGSFGNLEEAANIPKPTKKTGGRVRPASQTYDHIIAERKRREVLSQRFVALSSIVPGLKKMDKTSVLGDTINYLKHLKERVHTLEEKTAKQTMQSVVLVKKSQVIVEDEESSDEMSAVSEEQPLPEIEAKVCNKTVLLRIHCEKQKGLLVKILSEVGELNLAVTNTNVAPFGSLSLDITIIAEMEKEFNLTTIELIKTLRSALQHSPPLAD